MVEPKKLSDFSNILSKMFNDFGDILIDLSNSFGLNQQKFI